MFLPPLLFADGWRIPKWGFFRDGRTILALALGLVVFTVLGMGLFIHWLIQAMPLAVAFALAAVLSPDRPDRSLVGSGKSADAAAAGAYSRRRVAAERCVRPPLPPARDCRRSDRRILVAAGASDLRAVREIDLAEARYAASSGDRAVIRGRFSEAPVHGLLKSSAGPRILFRQARSGIQKYESVFELDYGVAVTNWLQIPWGWIAARPLAE